MSFAFAKPKRPVSKVFIHCTATESASYNTVEAIRADHKRKGWSDIGYHFLITKDGTIHAGRSLELVPSAQVGHNVGSIAICLAGLHKDKFTHSQIDALADFCIKVNAAYDGKITFHGHREVSAKACPVIDYQSILSLDAEGRLGAGVDAAEADADIEVDQSRVMRLGSKGRDVVTLQARLTAAGFPSGVNDGDFGKRTEAAVKAFQKANHLTPDGIVGPLTLEVLAAKHRAPNK